MLQLVQRGVGLAGITGACLALAACGGGGSDASAEGSAQIPAGCSTPPFDASDAGATVLGRVHFPGYVTPGWKQGDELQTDPRGKGGDFAKQALEVHGVELVVLQVPRNARRSIDLTGWGSTTGRFRSDTVRIELGDSGQCEGIWPGGFFFKRDRCLKLNVKADGRTAKVPFGLGRSCA